jgi:hypothetical protein
MRPLGRAALLAATLLAAACATLGKGGDANVSAWNAVWPTPPDHAYWGTWQSPAADSWLQIESNGEGAVFRAAGEPEAGWIRTPLRVVPAQWSGGWDFVTESGVRYRLRAAGEGWIAVSGPGGEQQYTRAALPPEVWAAAPYRPPSAQGGPPEFDTEENWVDSWWPF